MNLSKIAQNNIESKKLINSRLLRKFLPYRLFIGNFAKFMTLKAGVLNGDGYTSP